jgi:hypothetical protein
MDVPKDWLRDESGSPITVPLDGFQMMAPQDRQAVALRLSFRKDASQPVEAVQFLLSAEHAAQIARALLTAITTQQTPGEGLRSPR